MTSLLQSRFAALLDEFQASRGIAANNGTFYNTLGDSRLDQEDADTLSRIKSSVGFVNQLNYRPTFNNRLRRGVKGAKSGYTTAESLAIYGPSVLASKSPLVFLFGAINDIQSGYTFSQVLNGYRMNAAGTSGSIGDSVSIGGIRGMVTLLTAQGKRVVLLTDYPQQGSDYLYQFLQYNLALREIARSNPLVTLIDTWPLLTNPNAATTATILNTALFQTDAPIQHINMAGAMLIAARLETELAPFIPAVDHLRVSNRFDGPMTGADAATLSNIMWNSLFQEAGVGPSFQGAGTFAGAGTLTSGTVPNGYRLVAPTGISVVLTTPARADGAGNNVQLAITAAQAGVVSLTQGFNPAGRAGQNPPLSSAIVQQALDVDVTAGSSGFAGVQLDSLYDGDAQVAGGANNVSGAFMNAGPTAAYSQKLIAPRVQIGTNAFAGNCYSRASMVFTGAGSATINLGRFENRLRPTL